MLDISECEPTTQIVHGGGQLACTNSVKALKSHKHPSWKCRIHFYTLSARVTRLKGSGSNTEWKGKQTNNQHPDGKNAEGCSTKLNTIFQILRAGWLWMQDFQNTAFFIMGSSCTEGRVPSSLAFSCLLLVEFGCMAADHGYGFGSHHWLCG